MAEAEKRYLDTYNWNCFRIIFYFTTQDNNKVNHKIMLHVDNGIRI